MAETALDRGKAELKLNRFHAARQEFINAIKERPGDQKAYLFLGRTLEILKEWDDAKATYLHGVLFDKPIF